MLDPSTVSSARPSASDVKLQRVGSGRGQPDVDAARSQPGVDHDDPGPVVAILRSVVGVLAHSFSPEPVGAAVRSDRNADIVGIAVISTCQTLLQCRMEPRPRKAKPRLLNANLPGNRAEREADRSAPSAIVGGKDTLSGLSV